MTSMLEISDKEFKITIINILKSLMEKVDNVKGQMDHVCRKRKTKKKSKWNVRIRKHWIRNEEFISWAHQQIGHEIRIIKHKDMSIETYPNEIQERIFKNIERSKRNIWGINIWNFSIINATHKITQHRARKAQRTLGRIGKKKNYTKVYHIQSSENQRQKENFLKKSEAINIPYL